MFSRKPLSPKDFPKLLSQYSQRLRLLQKQSDPALSHQIDDILDTIENRLFFAATIEMDGKIYLPGAYQGKNSRTNFLIEFTKGAHRNGDLLSGTKNVSNILFSTLREKLSLALDYARPPLLALILASALSIGIPTFFLTDDDSIKSYKHQFEQIGYSELRDIRTNSILWEYPAIALSPSKEKKPSPARDSPAFIIPPVTAGTASSREPVKEVRTPEGTLLLQYAKRLSKVKLRKLLEENPAIIIFNHRLDRTGVIQVGGIKDVGGVENWGEDLVTIRIDRDRGPNGEMAPGCVWIENQEKKDEPRKYFTQVRTPGPDSRLLAVKMRNLTQKLEKKLIEKYPQLILKNIQLNENNGCLHL
ncbi:MAG: hypothetical protein HYY63_06690, partial [Elusimicrobia bacterium]|nr:hypothetical protein [Elusimicrobiota bacterium]